MKSLWLGLLFCLGVLGAVLPAEQARSAGFRSPEECLAYSGDAHLNCLYAYIEIQADKIGKLEELVKARNASTQQLQDQINAQKPVTEELLRRLEDRNPPIQQYGQLQISPYYGLSFYYGLRFSPFRHRHLFVYPFGYPCYGPYCW
jgi:hypothetical protein